MFASQLLRILQTIPADVNYETWDLDIPEVKLTMKKDKSDILCHSNGFERVADPLAFQMENVHDSLHASVLKCSAVADIRTTTDDDKARDPGKLGDHEGPLCHSNDGAAGTELSDHEDKLRSSPKFESSIIVDGEKESRDSEKLCTNVSSLFVSESDSLRYTDKSVREWELSVCYRDSNYQIVKDICVDEGLPTQDKTLIEAEKDGHPGMLTPQPCQDQHSGTIRGCHDTEPGQDGLKASTVDDITNSVSIDCGAKVEVDISTFFMEGSKSSLEEHAGKDATKVRGPGNVTQMGEANWSSTERRADDVSEDESAVISGRSSQESVVQDSIQLLSNCDGNKAPKQLDEVPSVDSILESLAVAFTADASKKSGTANNLHYNSKVESGTITFDFKSPKPAIDSHADESAENSHEEVLKSEGVLNHKQENLTDQSAALIECGSSTDKNETTVHEPKAQQQDAVDHPSQVHRGGGESSFSSTGPLSGLITYSGPIAYSGSTSLRSDSSTTSTRSFAFPILQSEWNSSPVRMTKAERRHIRKHRGWIQGLFCCRF
nr:uncharacterized protein LOC113716801 isoform X1 [Coffea arabica]XP_027097056.1 uncharacterized protein LOC113716801 isoform X1 [Coffea arabica]XP_027097057.1 uncharacterized protein LOC113716801 isoform X1 [Coffea arabica]XP_027097058.1 uncharacterized protein LOC113716801 isoform X1 [Coffea arabica]XP_027097059.1 uncharacterized protein LOC113716801 isoform X1 [Coffea arabica]